MDHDHDEILKQFQDVTSANAERSQFYLESSGWNLEIALASFFENDGDGDVEVVEPEPQVVESDDSEAEEAATPVSKAKTKKPKAKQNSKFATLASLANEEDSSDEEEGQAFYAGGSEHSGQQVLGPAKKKQNFVSEMFKSVKEHGAEVVDPSPSRGRPNTFAGTGYRLGQSSNDTEVIASPTEGNEERRHSEVTLRFWKDGFSVDDGELREYSDPNNAEFLAYVRRGLVPLELVQKARGGEVHLNMEDHHHEEYTTPKTKVKAFAGKGHLLGSPSPATVGAVGAVDQKDVAANEEAAREAAKVDDAAPTTTLQIRLADGSRLQARFNHTHTVADVRRYIVTARPQYEMNTFALLTSFPSKELTDETQTLVDAGVLNSALLQRLKNMEQVSFDDF
ncbi:NSFL1 cofactor p47 [Nilaparvata lugens]|uniref:NSFL1 cofactor p47 n=1 Tax=Nilaparvata lugens TaxID=108931 RepID=UPI00193D16EA|nr:NSFL1 cofactor p47 [Nilaparvata lugens]